MLTLAERFWKKVAKSSECWVWTGGRLGGKYGRIRYLRDDVWTHEYAHRVSWELHFGTIPEGLWVLHECDNPPCVRPDHLFLGTQLDNINDMLFKKRGRNGSSVGVLHGRAKLSESEVYAIRKRVDSDETIGSVAEEYRVSSTLIRYIKQRQV